MYFSISVTVVMQTCHIVTYMHWVFVFSASGKVVALNYPMKWCPLLLKVAWAWKIFCPVKDLG